MLVLRDKPYFLLLRFPVFELLDESHDPRNENIRPDVLRLHGPDKQARKLGSVAFSMQFESVRSVFHILHPSFVLLSQHDHTCGKPGGHHVSYCDERNLIRLERILNDLLVTSEPGRPDQLTAQLLRKFFVTRGVRHKHREKRNISIGSRGDTRGPSAYFASVEGQKSLCVGSDTMRVGSQPLGIPRVLAVQLFNNTNL